MTDEQLQRVKRLLAEAVELPAAQVPVFLDRHCSDDPQVRAEIERLLSIEGVDSHAVQGTTLDEQAASDAVGNHIGPYRVLRRIGEGGMGVVYEAEQVEPVRRRVALKLIKWGMDTRQVVARFESERQALALMKHPNIAAVYDGGATEQGRPYFAMEFVAGISITEYCDKNRLSTEERLRLFAVVCDGVQHAHQKGVIHRDLKPSNVLVEERDGKPVPKIIDFGVAKATEQRLTEKSVFTEIGQLVGTPEYMSPEQAEMTALDIDTRTDVYSLGVLLYELLVGALPFDSGRLRSAGFDEIRRAIREVEPPRPSTRISTLGPKSAESARQRRTDVSGLQRRLRGDLDWITMRALEKQRGRRYASASELAADILRHLRDEPILAGPPSASYRLGKFVRRHRFGVATAAAAVIGLIAVAAMLAFQANRVARERDRANQEATSAVRALDFIEGLFISADPSRTRGEEITAREILDRGMERVESELADEPDAAVRLLNTLGKVYMNLGLTDDAEKVIGRAVQLGSDDLGEEHPYTIAALDEKGWLRYHQGHYDEAQEILTRTVELNRQVHGEEHLDTASSMSLLGTVYVRQGRHAEGEELERKALAVRRSLLGDEHNRTLESMSNLAIALRMQGHYDEALKLYNDVLETRTRIDGEDHPQTLRTMNNMGNVYAMSGRFEEAEQLYMKMVRHRLKVLGKEHRETLMAMSNLATVRDRLGRYEESVEGHLEVLELRTEVLGPDHPYTLMSKNLLADAYVGLERFEESEALHKEVLETRRRTVGPDHPFTAFAMITLGTDYFAQGRYEDAEEVFRDTVEIRARINGKEHQETLLAIVNVAMTLHKQGRYEQAERMYRESLDVQRRTLDENHPDVAATMYYLGCVEALRGRTDVSLEWLRQSVEAGFVRAASMAEEKDLESLRGLPEFEALLERARGSENDG